VASLTSAAGEIPRRRSFFDRCPLMEMGFRGTGQNISRNLLCALRHAKQSGVQFLFIDVISIDQRLDGNKLLEQVVAFSTLYRTIPVIAAYDKMGEFFMRTMRRPWILYEARAVLTNPTKIVHVGHYNQGAKEAFGFEHMLKRIWNSSFTPTVIGVLCGTIKMQSVSDFKFHRAGIGSKSSTSHINKCARTTTF
jgi:hypothetical protein